MNLIQQTLIQQSWQAGRVYYQGLLATWIVLGWAFIFFSGYQYIGMVFGIAAIVGGALFGGYPVTSGTEEFLMGLPATRTQQFRVRFGMGLLPILVLSIASLLMYWFNLPQRFWGIFFSSGYTTFYPEMDVSAFWPLCLTLPLSLYACTFVFASLCQQSAKVGVAAMLGWILPASIAGIGVYLDGFSRSTSTQGVITVALSIILFVVITILGDRAYANKEAAIGSSIVVGKSGTVAVVIAVVVVVQILVFFSFIS